MKSNANETKIVLQVGSSVRIKKLVGQDNAADAALMYRFDPQAGGHTIRLVDPVADRAQMKTHRRSD